MSIKVIVADDHQIVREGLCSLLQGRTDMEIIAEASDGRETIRLVHELQPDVVIMDVTMPGLNGIDATRQIVTNTPRVKIIALSMHADRRFVSQILQAGALGYVLKDGAFDELCHAIRTVVINHKMYLSPAITGQIVQDYLNSQTIPDSRLSESEREVLQLLAEGKTVKEIAVRLKIGAKTVETHRMRIMDKLDMRSIAQLTKYAIREGLTPLDYL